MGRVGRGREGMDEKGECEGRNGKAGLGLEGKDGKDKTGRGVMG